MQRKGPDRGRSWLGSNPLLLLLFLLALPLLFMFRSDSGGTPLGYGEFKQVLQAPGVLFRDIKVGATDLHGKMILNDHYSGAKSADYNPNPEEKVFRVSRQGLILDDDMPRLLDKFAGGAYQADEDESTSKGVMSFLFLVLVMGAILALTFVVIRWVSGGNSPFNFGRSRHKLYAQK